MVGRLRRDRRLQHAGDWDAAARVLADAASRLERAGAEALVLCTNTMHKLADEIQAAVDIPLLHIADATRHAAAPQRCRRPALLATGFTMEQPFYKGRLSDRFGLASLVSRTPPAGPTLHVPHHL